MTVEEVHELLVCSENAQDLPAERLRNIKQGIVGVIGRVPGDVQGRNLTCSTIAAHDRYKFSKP